jgi:hypothetical protein
MFLLTIQQAPCHSSGLRIFLSHYNCLAEKRRRAAGIRRGSKYIFSIQFLSGCEKKLCDFKSMRGQTPPRFLIGILRIPQRDLGRCRLVFSTVFGKVKKDA